MITRENYEEFFVSYVDNELPAETRLAVERFVAAHPDLREELEILQQCRLEPEPEAVFPDKKSLFQYEESLLLYVDGELDASKRAAIEELASREPRIGLELEQLKMTVSQADPSIVFPEKEKLLRSTKGRRVVMLPWLQASAAAAVLAVAVLSLLPHGHKTDTPVAAAVVKNNTDTVTPVVASPLYSGKNAQPATTSAANSTAAIPLKKTRLPAPAVAKKTRGDNGNSRMPSTNPATSSEALVAKNSRTTANSTAASIAETTSNARTISNPTTTSNTTAASNAATALDPTATANASTPHRMEKSAATSVAKMDIPREQRSFATQALLQDAHQEGDGDMADNMPPATGKTKLRGLFRRVTRAFGKTADRDDDGGRQVSISVFQVALK